MQSVLCNRTNKRLNSQLKTFLARRAPQLRKLGALARGEVAPLLGLHREADHWVLLSWVPNAVRAWADGRPLTRIGAGPVYGWAGAEPPTSPWRLRWRDARGVQHERLDPYAFAPDLPAEALIAHAQGSASAMHQLFGAHPLQRDGVNGLRFAVWAPRALEVLLVLDPIRLPLRAAAAGAWELFVPDLAPGCCYRYEIVSEAGYALKTDPYARQLEERPGWRAIATANSTYPWTDQDWLAARATRGRGRPTSVYELHLGSFAQRDGAPLNYRELAERIVAHVVPLGFTDVELLPVMEHPHAASWGYQTSGYFAPTARHGSPNDFRAFVDHLHRAGLGVILDWTPAHFATDPEALARFDGEALYEHADPRRGEHRDWGTLAFDFDRPEVHSFLLSSARYWLEEFHVDGLRVDAVAAMLYLDYQRAPDAWLPEADGGNEHRAAVRFLQALTSLVHERFAGVELHAEDSSIRPGTTAPVAAGGLGFDYKWSLGWMHDSLRYFGVDPLFRRHHHDELIHATRYAANERYLLPLSHDEVVHGKRSLLRRLPGDAWQQHATLRLLYAWQWTHPGAKLLFMGGEAAQATEWDHRHALPQPKSAAARGIARLVADLNALYRQTRALQADGPDSLVWLDTEDRLRSIYAFERRAGCAIAVVVLNATPVPRYGVRIGLPFAGRWLERLNTDAKLYGGSNVGNLGEVAAAQDPAMGRPYSAAVTLPPLGAIVLVPA